MTPENANAAEPETLAPFRRLLVACSPFENGQGAFANAAALAKTWDAELSALAVVELPKEIDHISGATNISHDDIVGRLVDAYREELLGVWNRLAPNLDPMIEVRVGKPYVETVRYVLANNVDMLFKTADEVDGLHRYLFSSTDRHLLRKCPCPVWLCHPKSAPSVRTVLAAVDADVSAASEPETLMALNRCIIETAVRIAGGEGGTVTLLHVWDAPEEDFVRRWSDSPKVAESYVNRVQANHERALYQLVEETRAWLTQDLARRVEIVPILQRGNARDVIPDRIREQKTDLLVMGTVARTGVPGVIIGNTAEDILNGIDCSVVTVKPPNYVSPLTVDESP